MRLEFRYQPRFGSDLFAPICERSKKLCEFANRKNLTPHHLDLVRAIGFDVIIKDDKTP